MNKPIVPTALSRIEECSDMMVDACLCDEQNDLMFLSVWGRDTAIQEFLARLTLGTDENGLDQFNIRTGDDVTFPVFVRNVDLLQKRTTRTIPRTLFGSLVHLWLIDGRCIEPDKANAKALAIFPKDVSDRDDRLWSLVKKTCPLPLLDHWRDSVLELLHSRSMLTTLPLSLGELQGYRLALDVPTLTTVLGSLIREGTLAIHPPQSSSDVPIRRAA